MMDQAIIADTALTYGAFGVLDPKDKRNAEIIT
jgi:hypothetical protein